MRKFEKFQKGIIKTLSKHADPKEIDLSAILMKLLPSDFYIGVDDPSHPIDTHYCFYYKNNQYDQVYGKFSKDIFSFITLIDELVKHGYITRANKRTRTEKMSIGKKPTDWSNYSGYPLGFNLTYEKLNEMFVQSSYYTTQDLIELPKQNYLDQNDFWTLKQLRLTRLSVYIAASAIFIDVVFRIFQKCP